MKEKIFITKTYLPPIEEYIKFIEGIWKRNQLTNNGPLVQELEERLKKYFNVKHVFFVGKTANLCLSILTQKLYV